MTPTMNTTWVTANWRTQRWKRTLVLTYFEYIQKQIGQVVGPGYVQKPL